MIFQEPSSYRGSRSSWSINITHLHAILIPRLYFYFIGNEEGRIYALGSHQQYHLSHQRWRSSFHTAVFGSTSLSARSKPNAVKLLAETCPSKIRAFSWAVGKKWKFFRGRLSIVYVFFFFLLLFKLSCHVNKGVQSVRKMSCT